MGGTILSVLHIIIAYSSQQFYVVGINIISILKNEIHAGR